MAASREEDEDESPARSASDACIDWGKVRRTVVGSEAQFCTDEEEDAVVTADDGDMGNEAERDERSGAVGDAGAECEDAIDCRRNASRK